MSIRASMTVSLLGFVVALAGCSGGAVANSGTEAPEAGTTAAAVTAAASPEAHAPGMRGHRPPGGPEALLFAALKEPIGISDAQKATIQTALDDSRPKAPPAIDGARFKALAAGIRAGSVDGLAVRPTGMDEARAAHLAASAKALGTLYATLTKDQRVALVDGMSKRGEHRMPDKTDGAPRAHKDHARHGGHGPMGGLLEGLDLTEAQTAAIHAKLGADRPSHEDHETRKAQHAAHRAEMQKRLAAFAGDSFDANAFLAHPVGETRFEGQGDPMTKMLSAVLPILDPGQREKLAAKIEQGPRAPMHANENGERLASARVTPRRPRAESPRGVFASSRPRPHR